MSWSAWSAWRPGRSKAAAAPTPGFVQAVATGATLTSSTLTLTVGVTTTVGNTVLIAARAGFGIHPTSATDSRSNSYVVDVFTASQNTAAIVRARLTTALRSGDAITITFSAAAHTGNANAAWAGEYAGIIATSPVDGSTSKSQTTGVSSTITTTPITPTQAGDVFFSAWAQAATVSTTVTVGSPFTRRWFYNQGVTGRAGAAADFLDATTAAHSVTWTSTTATNHNNSAALVAYKT